MGRAVLRNDGEANWARIMLLTWSAELTTPPTPHARRSRDTTLALPPDRCNTLCHPTLPRPNVEAGYVCVGGNQVLSRPRMGSTGTTARKAAEQTTQDGQKVRARQNDHRKGCLAVRREDAVGVHRIFGIDDGNTGLPSPQRETD